jgi:YVTN family beta-propeller protein
MLIAGGLGVAGCSRKQRSLAMLAFIANRSGRAVAVVDLATLALVRHVHLDADPSVVLTRRKHPAVYAVTPDTGTIHEIDPVSLAAARKVRVGSGISWVSFQPDGTALWCLTGAGRQLVRIPVQSLQPDRRIALPEAALDVDFALEPDPGSAPCAVSFGKSGQFGLVDPAAGRLLRTFHLGSALGKIRFRKDGRLLMIADLGANRLVIHDVASGRLAVTLPLPLSPENFCFKLDLGQLFVSGPGRDAVVAVYPYQTEVGATILAGRAPGYLAASTAPDYLFVANPSSGNVTIINIDSQRVLAVATVGQEPCHIAVTPNNEYALVLNRRSGDVAVLHVGTLTSRKRYSVPILTMVPVGSEPVSAVVRIV